MGRFSRPRKKLCKDIPGNIKELLKLLIGEKVIIVLSSGESECVKVEAVIGNLLLADVCNKFNFIDICCICAVIVECEDILENIFRNAEKCGFDSDNCE